MKNLFSRSKIFSAYICIIVFTVSCNKDFLERAPSDFVDKDEVFTTIDNAEAFINGIYIPVPHLLIPGQTGGEFILDSGTDISINMWPEWTQTSIALNSGNWNPALFPMSNRWKEYFNAIRRANLFLENQDLIPTETEGQRARKQRMIGEAYGLRAFYYFQLFKMFGEVPIIENTIDPGGQETVYPRASIDDVVAFIRADLKLAEDHLLPRLNSSEFGRFTSVVAKSLLSRVNLYYASPLFNEGGDVARWEAAAQSSDEALTYALANGYDLSRGALSNKRAYERIFLEELNPEIIWSNGLDGYKNNGNYWDFILSTLGYGGDYGEAPSQGMIDSYEMINGELPVLGYTSDNQQIINPAANYNPASPYQNRDPRFYQTIGFHGDTWSGRQVNFQPGGLDYSTGRPRVNYFWKKYVIEERDLVTGQGFYQRRFITFRLAELYLNQAEALNEVSGATPEVYELVNTIRRRVNMNDLPAGLSKEAMRERIRRERKVEFAMEGHRFWDVRRWKIAENVDNGPIRKVDVNASGQYTYPVWGIRVFDKTKHYLFPIPQSEMDKMNGEWKQNPGW